MGEYLNKYLKERYHQRRREVIEFLGGQCSKCGSDDRLKVVPEIKQIHTKALLRVMEEVKTRKLLCLECSKRNRGKPVIIDGFYFESIREASELLKIGHDTVLKIGKLVDE